MIFYRILDNKLYFVHETDVIGFNATDASYIPDTYLEQQQFVVMRTAHGIGDWGIISAMPRLLKQKYPTDGGTFVHMCFILKWGPEFIHRWRRLI